MIIRKKDFKDNFSNEALEFAIKEVLKDNSQDNQNLLIEEILNTYLYTLIDVSEKEDTKSKSLNLLQRLNDNKEAFLPVFTNIDEMIYAKQKCDFEEVLLDFDEIVGVILDKTSDFKGFIINADSDEIVIEDELINYIIDKIQEKKDETKVEIAIGEEVEIDEIDKQYYPKDMVESLINHFKENKNITKSYLRLLTRNNEQSYLLITEFNGSKDETFSKISEVVRPYLKDVFLDQLDFNTKFGMEVTKDIKPFYKKKRLGIF